MSAVVVDPVTFSRLSSVGSTVTLTDAAGNVAGLFVPAVAPALRQSLEPDISEEELQRREKQGGGRTLAEILKDLGQ